MSAPGRPRAPDSAIDRLVVVLDLVAHDLPEIGAAAELAARFGAAIEGLFVEDANLFRLAALPVARQILRGPPLGGSAFDPAQMEASLRAMARRAEDALSLAARRAGVRWSFRALRGDVPAAVISEAASRDLLVFTAPAAPRPSLGSAVPQLCCAALAAERSFVLLSRADGLRRPLVVLGSDAALADAALGAGAVLRTDGGRTLDVALAGKGSAVSEATVAAALRARGLEPRFRRLAGAGVADIGRAASAAGNDVLVLAADLPCLAGGGAGDLAAAAPCPAIVVR